MLKLASWNVNSLKVRLEQVLMWLDSSNADILALQETKVVDAQFPAERFKEHGFHVVFSGQKTYNGVALISRYPIDEMQVDIPDLNDPQRRILAATIAGTRVINLYVPNGSELGSDKYEYKLMWLATVKTWIKDQLKAYPQLAVVGDFNIAPADLDVHSPAEWVGQVHVSPKEREAFQALIALGLIDSFRDHYPDQPSYSWWDYRAAAFRRNRGLRIDHILLSKILMEQCIECGIDVTPRQAERPSDHTPVWVSLNNN